jgi:hypothetical protein
MIKWKIIWFFNLDIWKEKKRKFFSLYLLIFISIDKLFKKIQMYIYSSFYFLISYICLPISLTHILCILNDQSLCIHSNEQGVFLYTHTHIYIYDWIDHTIISSIVSYIQWMQILNLEKKKTKTNWHFFFSLFEIKISLVCFDSYRKEQWENLALLSSSRCNQHEKSVYTIL